MPVNYLQIQDKVKEMGQNAPLEQKLLKERLRLARELLQSYANRQSELDRLRLSATRLAPGLRCAVPGAEPLTFCGPEPTCCETYVLLAADGSQINPDRHGQVEFAVINTGAIRLLPGQPETPLEVISSELFYGDNLQAEFGMMAEELVATLAKMETLPVVTLTDGQLELFREPQLTREYEKHLRHFMEALRELAAMRAVTAGYVDKPRADLVG